MFLDGSLFPFISLNQLLESSCLFDRAQASLSSNNLVLNSELFNSDSSLWEQGVPSRELLAEPKLIDHFRPPGSKSLLKMGIRHFAIDGAFAGQLLPRLKAVVTGMCSAPAGTIFPLVFSGCSKTALATVPALAPASPAEGSRASALLGRNHRYLPIWGCRTV